MLAECCLFYRSPWLLCLLVLETVEGESREKYIILASHRRLRQEVKLILLFSSPVLGTTVNFGSGVTDLGQPSWASGRCGVIKHRVSAQLWVGYRNESGKAVQEEVVCGIYRKHGKE